MKNIMNDIGIYMFMKLVTNNPFKVFLFFHILGVFILSNLFPIKENDIYEPILNNLIWGFAYGIIGIIPISFIISKLFFDMAFPTEWARKSKDWFEQKFNK